MSTTKNANNAVNGTPVPENLPEELLPVYDWWQQNGRTTIIVAVLAAVVALGCVVGRRHLDARAAGANAALREAQTVEDLEIAVTDYGSTDVGKVLRLRLAKAYYDAARYQEAFDAYDACIAAGTPKEMEAIPVLGKAFALEGLAKYDAAQAAFEAFGKDFPNSYLANTATLGAIRVVALQGNKDEALKQLENVKAAATDDAAMEAAVERLESLIKRYEPRAARSLFDAADAAVKALDAEAAPVVEQPAAAPTTPTK